MVTGTKSCLIKCLRYPRYIRTVTVPHILLGNNNNKYKTGQLGNLTITKKHWRRQKIFKGGRRGQGGVDVAKGEGARASQGAPPPPPSWLRQCKKVADLSRYGVLRAEGGKIGPVGPGQLTARVAAGELLAARDARRVVVARCRGHQPGQDGPLGHLHI